MDNITPPQISEDRLRELKTQSFNAVMHGADRDEDDLLAELVAAERDRQWLERLELVTTGRHGTVLMDGAVVCCNEHDREPCPSQPERRCKSCPGNATLYRIKEQG